MIDFFNFIFLDVWHFFGFFLILFIIYSAIINITNSFFEMIPKIIHGRHDNFYIGKADITEEFLNKIKKDIKIINNKEILDGKDKQFR